MRAADVLNRGPRCRRFRAPAIAAAAAAAAAACAARRAAEAAAVMEEGATPYLRRQARHRQPLRAALARARSASLLHSSEAFCPTHSEARLSVSQSRRSAGKHHNRVHEVVQGMKVMQAIRDSSNAEAKQVAPSRASSTSTHAAGHKDPTLLHPKGREHVPRRPPGSAHGLPGHTMHQQGSLPGWSLSRYLASPALLPIYPLFIAVGAGLGLAGWIVYRHHYLSPGITFSKDRRKGFPEIDDPQFLKQGEYYSQSSALRKLSHSRDVDAAGMVKDVQHALEPPALPGDDKAAVGKPGGKGMSKPMGSTL
eukprot:SM000018S03671  [mRNA]  locus=s18:778829:780667:+ [translate_table: standard]